MSAIKKYTAKVALLEFAKEKERFAGLRRLLVAPRWRLVGSVKEYQVLYWQIPWQEQDFLKLDLERQRQVFIKILKNAKKQGCIICGLPMHWRLILSGNNIIDIPCGKELALTRTIEDLAAAAGGLAGRKVAVLGVDDRFSKQAVDKLLAADCDVMLTGVKARSLADWYYRNYGLAIPVFRTEKACEAADCVLSLAGAVPQKYEKQSVIYGDSRVRIAGEWQQPFADGRFSCGLAAALLAVGGKRADEADYLHWQLGDEEKPLSKIQG